MTEDSLAFRERMLEVARVILDDLPLGLHGFTRDGWLRSAVSSTPSVFAPDPRLGLALLRAYESAWSEAMDRYSDDDWLVAAHRTLEFVWDAQRLAQERGVELPRLEYAVELLSRTEEDLHDDG